MASEMSIEFVILLTNEEICAVASVKSIAFVNDRVNVTTRVIDSVRSKDWVSNLNLVRGDVTASVRSMALVNNLVKEKRLVIDSVNDTA